MADDIRVLIVEDDFAVAGVHRRFVEAIDGFVVVGAELTAGAGAERIAAGGVDLVLLDMFLPDASGIDLLRRIRSAASDGALDVLMITAAPEQSLVRQAFELGAVDYVLKPVQPDDFRQRLLRYAARRTALDEMPADALTQEQIDALQGRRRREPQTALPKGLSAATARTVVESLREQAQPISAAELGEALGMSRVSARRYLEYFVAHGDVEVKPRHGVAGRPQLLYRWVGSDSGQR